MKLAQPLQTLVINLAKDSDRMQHISEQYNGLQQFNLYRIDGVLGSSLPVYAQRQLFGPRVNELHSGNLGCFLSHVKAWEYVQNSKEWTLIIEDDAELVDPDLLFTVDFPDNADLIFVNERCDPFSRRTTMQIPGEVLPMIDLVHHKTDPKRNGQSVGGDGYILSPQGASVLLSTITDDAFIALPDGLLFRYSLAASETHSLISGTWLEDVRMISSRHSLPCSWNVLRGYCLSPAAIRESRRFTSSRFEDMATPDIYLSRIQSLLNKGRTNAAYEKIKKAIERFPSDNRILKAASDIEYMQGDAEKSTLFIKDLMEHSNANPEALAKDINESLRSNSYLNAKTLYDLSIKKFPNDATLLALGCTVSRLTSGAEEALECSSRMIKLHPIRWEGYAAAINALLSLGRHEEALDIASRGLEAIPDSIILSKRAAYLHTYLGLPTDIDCKKYEPSYRLDNYDLITFSCCRNYFSALQAIKQQKQKSLQATQDCPSDKNYLFVAGLARSGTTALGVMLNISKSIEMYTELYNPMRIEGYTANEFSAIAIQSKLGNRPNAEKERKTFQDKHLTSKYIGDKRPGFQFCLESTYDNLHDSANLTTIYLHRDVHSVARSYQMRKIKRLRSSGANKGWNDMWDIRYAVLSYNASCRQILHLNRVRPDVYETISFVNYKDVLSNIEEAISVFEGVNIQLDAEELEQLESFIQHSSPFASREKKRDELGDEVELAIDQLLDKNAHDEFCELTGMST